MEILIASIAGMVGTLIASGLGLYFTARARTAPLRHLLYAKQLDAVIETMKLIGRIRIFSILLVDPSGEYSERARQDITELIPKLSRLIDVSAAILPTEIYVEMSKFGTAVSDFLDSFDEGQVDEVFPTALGGRSAKVALLARALLGIDELSDESLNLFSSSDDFQRLTRLTPDYLTTIGNGESPADSQSRG